MIKISNVFKVLIVLFVFASCSSNDDTPPIEDKIIVNTQDMIFSIGENPELNQVIGSVIGTTTQGNVQFYIISQTPENAFDIDENSGEITVKNTELYNYETLKVITGIVKVYNNDVSKESKITINITDKEDIFTGDVHLKTQEEVDEFASKQYNIIFGKLIIGYTTGGDTNITDLSGLSSIKIITGNFQVAENPELTNLKGLENITSTKVCVIYYNNKLEDISALSNLTSVESLRVSINPLIETIECFSKINSLTGFMDISSNNSLINLNGLHNITSVQNSVQIRNNGKLQDLLGLTSLKTIGSLSASDNQSLTSLNGLNSLEEIKKGVYISKNENLLEINLPDKIKYLTTIFIRENPKLNSLNGLSNLTELTYQSSGTTSLAIIKNQSLSNLIGLHNLQNIAGKVIIEGNENLLEIDSFNNITSLVDLEIKNNISLISLKGLANLTNIEAKLTISKNNALTTLDGLDNLELIKENLFITYNDELNNFCNLNKLVNNGFPINYSFFGNKYDPSLEDLKSGNCSI